MRYETGIACFRNPTDLKRKDKRKRKTKGRQNNETQSVRHSHVPSAENPVFLAYRTPYCNSDHRNPCRTAYAGFEQGGGKAYGISCVSNQKQIGTAYNMYTGDNAEYWPEIDIFTTPRMSHFEFFAEYYNLNPPVFVCPGAPLRTSKNKEELKSFYWESFTDAPKLDAFYKAESNITKRLCSYGTSEWILMKHATTEDKGGLNRPLKNSSFVSPSGVGIVGDSRLYNVAVWKRCSPKFIYDGDYASGNWRLAYSGPRHGDSSCNILFADGHVENRKEVYAQYYTRREFVRISPHRRDL